MRGQTPPSVGAIHESPLGTEYVLYIYGRKQYDFPLIQGLPSGYQPVAQLFVLVAVEGRLGDHKEVRPKGIGVEDVPRPPRVVETWAGSAGTEGSGLEPFEAQRSDSSYNLGQSCTNSGRNIANRSVFVPVLACRSSRI